MIVLFHFLNSKPSVYPLVLRFCQFTMVESARVDL